MPRSPSPPHMPRRPFREDSPPRYARDRETRDDYRYRGAPRYHGSFDRDRRDRDWRERERDREYDFSSRSTNGRGGWPPSREAERMRSNARDRERLRSPPRQRLVATYDRDDPPLDVVDSVKTRSEGTPEEGQITSPVITPATFSGLPARPRSPLPRSPPRRRSRSPLPYRRYERTPWRERERERDRDRDRDGEKDRDRGYYRPRSPSPRSPIRRHPSPSISTASTPSRGSQFSPVKRPMSPFNRLATRSPDKHPRIASPEPHSPSLPSKSLSQTPLPDPITSRPVTPVAPPSLPQPTTQGVPTGPAAFIKKPPTGPRSERMGLAPPSGPRALAHLYGTRPRVPVAIPIASMSAPSALVAKEVRETETTPAICMPTAPGSASGRLSWSERKSMLSHPTPERHPSNSFTSSPIVGSASHTPHRASSSPANSVSATPFPSFAPSVAEKAIKEEPRIGQGDLAEVQEQDEQVKIMAELPQVKVSFGGAAWEIELVNHNNHYNILLQSTLRAQSAQRHAAMILADAEAERIAAMERRKICEEQLMTGTLGVGIIG
ncbi:hypothetical protein L204_100612 [Cryptococcus depauperatus]|nr:hypothetical protein L204_01456 [Cryptococcus depauperatus CBS 7855]